MEFCLQICRFVFMLVIFCVQGAKAEMANTKCCACNEKIMYNNSGTENKIRTYDIMGTQDIVGMEQQYERVKRQVNSRSNSENASCKEILFGFRQALKAIIVGQINLTQTVEKLGQNMDSLKKMNGAALEGIRPENINNLLGYSGGRKRSNLNTNSPRKEILLKYLHNIPDSETISGTDSKRGVDTIHRISGEFPGVVALNMPGTSASGTHWKSFIQKVISFWNHGHLVSVNWHQQSPIIKIDSFTDTNDAADVERRYQDLIEDGGHFNKIWKEHLDILASYLEQLQMAGVITIVDILPWVNVKGYIWRGRHGVNGTMKLYQLTHDYLTEHHNLNSLIWTWSLDKLNMANLVDFWPGRDYVDVVSVYMWEQRDLSLSYQHLINVVGDKLLSMETLNRVPTPQLLAAQPRWTWFTALGNYFDNPDYNTEISIKATFNSPSVINRGNIDYFSNKQ